MHPKQYPASARQSSFARPGRDLRSRVVAVRRPKAPAVLEAFWLSLNGALRLDPGFGIAGCAVQYDWLAVTLRGIKCRYQCSHPTIRICLRKNGSLVMHVT